MYIYTEGERDMQRHTHTERDIQMLKYTEREQTETHIYRQAQ